MEPARKIKMDIDWKFFHKTLWRGQEYVVGEDRLTEERAKTFVELGYAHWVY